MHGHGPPALQAQLPTCVSVRAKQSLRRDTPAMPLSRKQRRLQSFLPSTVALWNSLPSSVLSCTSVSSFLVSLDSHLISESFFIRPINWQRRGIYINYTELSDHPFKIYIKLKKKMKQFPFFVNCKWRDRGSKQRKKTIEFPASPSYFSSKK